MKPKNQGYTHKIDKNKKCVDFLLEVPAKLRHSPNPATPNTESYRSDTHTSLDHPGPVLPIFPFAPVTMIEVVLDLGLF